MWKLSFILGAGLLVTACSVESEPETTTGGDPTTSEVSQGLTDLGSTLRTNVVAGNTCGLNNGISPTCDASNASDISYSWTAPTTASYKFATTGDFANVVQVAPFTTPFSPLACNATGTSNASLSLSLSAGQQIIVTVDGHAALCGNYSLSITRNCTSSCTAPPPCGISPGTCSTTGVCTYQSLCGSDETCRANKCVPTCTINPRVPC